MRIQFAALILAGCLTVPAALPYKLPPKAKYTVSDADVTKGKAMLSVHLSTNAATLTKLFVSPVICGPGLWQVLKDSPHFSKPPHAKGTARIPRDDGSATEMPFAYLQTEAEVASFRHALADLLSSQGKLKVREPNELEFKKYWAVIPYDEISEALLVAEGKDVTILCQFGKGRVFWVDEPQQIKY